jgi:hypothetical protein
MSGHAVAYLAVYVMLLVVILGPDERLVSGAR